MENEKKLQILLEEKTLQILLEVKQERINQDRKWGVQNHNPANWFLILNEEIGEAAKEVLEYNFSCTKPSGVLTENEKCDRKTDYRKELIQSAAVIVAMIESLDRGNI